MTAVRRGHRRALWPALALLAAALFVGFGAQTAHAQTTQDCRNIGRTTYDPFCLTGPANILATVGVPYTSPTFPAATGGKPIPSISAAAGRLRYSVFGNMDLPAGLSFVWSATNRRQIEGTPTTAQAETTYTYQVEDDDRVQVSRTFTITVRNAPAVTASGTYQVPENSAPNTTVGAALTTSDFVGSGGTWSITGGNTGNAFSISSSGQIQVAGALDHETTPSYTLTVQFAQGDDSASTSVPVTVADVNEAPAASGTVTAVSVALGAGAATRDVASAFDDPEDDSLTYSATSGNTGIATVAVVGSTVSVTPVFPGSTTVTVTAEDPAGLTGMQTISVEVTRQPVAVAFAFGSYRQSEREGSVDICVEATAAVSADLEVSYELAEGSATEPEDYRIPASTVITIANGERQGCTDIPLVNDDDTELQESFRAILVSVMPTGTPTQEFALSSVATIDTDIGIRVSDTALHMLELSAGTLDPPFDRAVTAYTATVVNAVEEVTATPSVTAGVVSGAGITVNGDAVTSGMASNAIALSVGTNDIVIAVTLSGPDGADSETYTVTVTREPVPDEDARLSALTLSEGTLDPAFGAEVLAYGAMVDSGTASLTVTPTTARSGASVTVNGNDVTSGAASGAIALNPGTNTVEIEVTARNGTTTRTYTVTVFRPSADATLSALELSAGTLDPGFSAGTTAYDVTVTNATATLRVTPTTSHSAASVTVNGNDVTSGAASGDIALAVGTTAIAVVVTAEDGTTMRTYTVSVFRPSADATLSALELSAGTLDPGFDAAVTAYTATVANATASLTVTPTTAHSGASVTVNGTDVTSGAASSAIDLTLGTNTVTIVVTAEDGIATRTYAVAVFRPSADATLSALELSAGTLDPGFDAAVTAYRATVDNPTASLTVTPTTAHSGASVTVNGNDVTSGAASGAIALAVGTTDVTVLVTAEDASTRTYTVIVTREPMPQVDARLRALTLSEGTLTPAFTAETLDYDATVNSGTTGLTVTPTVANSAASVTVGGTMVNSGGASAVIPLSVGTNTVRIEVTAADGTTTRTYTVTVIRPSTDATLSALTLSAGTLSPAFAAGTTSYSAMVGNATTSLTVTPTAGNSDATITVNGNAVSSGAASDAIALTPGPNAIAILVTAQDTVTTRTYTVTVSRAPLPAMDARLSALVLSAGTLEPVFFSETINYAVTVDNTTTSLTVTPTTAHSGASVTVNGNTVARGMASGAIALNVGTNTITIEVTAGDGTTTRTYTVSVLRPSADATLRALALSEGALSPAFAPGTTAYTASVGNATASLTVTPTAAGVGASITVDGAGVSSGEASSAIDLNVGTNTITIEVTAEDGNAMQTYTVSVTRISPAEETEEINEMVEEVNEMVLPEVTRAITAGTVGSIAGRISAAAAPQAVPAPAPSLNFNGRTASEDALAAHANTMADGEANIKDILGNAGFVLPLNASGDGTTGSSAIALWGSGEYRELGGASDLADGKLDWDGDVFSTQLGIDARLPNNLLLGAAVSRSESDLDYRIAQLTAPPLVEPEGEYELELTTLNPYLGWTAPDGGFGWWATIGAGTGELKVIHANGGDDTSDMESRSVGIGANGRLVRRGGTQLRWKGEALHSELEVKGSDRLIDELDVDASRVRVALEAGRPQTLADGATFNPTAELGLRYDGGDGETGTGVEVGAGIRYANPATGVIVEGNARGLVSHSGAYEDWGVAGLVRLQSGADGQGVSFQLRPGYGDTTGEVQKIWRQGLRDDAIVHADNGAGRRNGVRLDARLGYGIPVPDWLFYGYGMLTPYTEMTLGDGSDSYRIGLNWKLDTRFELDLVGEHRKSDDDDAADPAGNAILLEGTMGF